ncbi:MAG: hypothetical protein M3R15_12765, partial [Acidobacteriota bacterium]|nr:hypothetical protein [Acidobacteriota bacterium]
DIILNINPRHCEFDVERPIPQDALMDILLVDGLNCWQSAGRRLDPLRAAGFENIQVVYKYADLSADVTSPSSAMAFGTQGIGKPSRLLRLIVSCGTGQTCLYKLCSW